MIRYTLHGIEYSNPTKNETIEYAANVYGYILNTPEDRNTWLSWREFALRIGDNYDMAFARNRAIVDACMAEHNRESMERI